MQMPEQAVADLVHPGRATRAALVPTGVEHEVADDELAPALEQIEEADPALGAIELVVLVDLDHRKPATLGVERISLPRELLFLRQQRLARDQPFLA